MCHGTVSYMTPNLFIINSRSSEASTVECNRVLTFFFTKNISLTGQALEISLHRTIKNRSRNGSAR